MKNIIILIIFTLSIISFGQSIRIKTGINFSDMLYSNRYETKSGFNLGLTTEFQQNNIISYETGIILSSKGFNLLTSHYEAKVNLLYLDFPLSAKISINIDETRLYTMFGMYLGAGIYGRTDFKVPQYDTFYSYSKKINWGEDIRKFDLGLNIGGGIEINSMQISASYLLGIVNTSDYNMIDNSRQVNSVLSISFGYQLGNTFFK